jgi:hypothetical protein
MGGCGLIRLTENCGLLVRRCINLSFVKGNMFLLQVTYFQVVRKTVICEIWQFSAHFVCVAVTVVRLPACGQSKVQDSGYHSCAYGLAMLAR